MLFKLTQKEQFSIASKRALKTGVAYLESVDNSYFFKEPFTKYAHIHSFLYGAPGAILSLLTAYDDNALPWSKIILI